MSNSFNQVNLMGNMTRDVQVSFLPSQTPVADFGLAVNKKWKTKEGEQRESVCFVDCKLFGNGATVLAQYCGKGSRLLVSGELALDQWDDKATGVKRSKHYIMVDQFRFIGSREDGTQPAQPTQNAPQRQTSPAPQRQPVQQSRQVQMPNRGPSQQPAAQRAPFGNEQQFKEEDIPFASMLPDRWI